jgi:hypothetical protein
MDSFDLDTGDEDVDEHDDETSVELEEVSESSATDDEVVVDPELTPRGDNTYVIQERDTPFIVAKDLYGNGNLGRDLVKKNPGCDWQAGSVINLL